MPTSPLVNSDGPVSATVTLDGTALPDSYELMSVRVDKQIGEIPRAAVVIRVSNLDLGTTPELGGETIKLGATVSIGAAYGDGDAQTLFDGAIMALRFESSVSGQLLLELTCRDTTKKLLEMRRSETYAESKDSQVMAKIIGDAGLQADVTATEDAARSHLRHAVSDWDFLTMLADRNGYVLIADAGKVTAAAPDTAGEPAIGVTYGVDIIDFEVAIDGQKTIGSAQIGAWDAQNQAAVSGSHSELPAMTLGSTTSAAIAEVLGTLGWNSSTAGEIAEADLTRHAKARVTRSLLASVQGRCRFQGTAAIKPGGMLAIGGLGGLFSNTAYVSAVRQDIRAGNWLTEATLGLPDDWATGRRNAPVVTGETTAPLLGLQIGKVMAITEDPAGQQRIKVSLPMIADPPAEIWARYAQPYATNTAGIQFMPEVDDEVLVGFLSADPNAPVVLGSLHSAALPQALAPTEENKIKGIVTRNDLRVLFDDDQKIITVTTPGGHKIRMDDAAKEVELVDLNGNSILFGDSGVTLKSIKDIIITATGKIDIKATQDATFKGSNVTCEGDMGFTGKGGAQAELSAGGQTTVKGAMVMIN